MAQLESISNVVPVYESGLDENGDPFIVMPFYSSGSLEHRVARGPMGWQDALELINTVAASVTTAHAQGILHLDIKPANVLLDAEGQPWLGDFGIAELMSHTASMSTRTMTPSFTPPERLNGSKPGERTDLYGLMATLFALLTGKEPCRPDSTTGPMDVMNAVLNDPLPLSQLPEGTPAAVHNLLARGMAKDPALRPASAIGLKRLIEDALEGRDIEPVVVD